MSEAAPITDDERDGLFGSFATAPLALAVSGGADSMALMHMIARWAATPAVRLAYAAHWLRATGEGAHLAAPTPSCIAPPRIASAGLARPVWLAGIETTADLRRAGGPPHVVVLTVDHGLRPTSAADARFVADAAARLGLPCAVLAWTGDKPATAVQERARAARRDLMLDVLRAEAAHLTDLARAASLPIGEARRLVLAHHQEDQAETLLMRLARGSGLEGLGAMRATSRAVREAVPERPTRFEVTVERPLLAMPKARLLATLAAAGAGHVEDASNDDARFERVRVRRALAALGEVGLTAEKIALSARRLQDADAALRQAVRQACDAPPAQTPPAHTQPDRATPAFCDFGLAGPRFATPYLAARSLRWLLAHYGGAAIGAELAKVEALAALMADAPRRLGAGGGVTLGGCKIEFHGEDARRLRIYREGGGDGLPDVPIAPGETVEWDGGRFRILAQQSGRTGAVVRALGRSGWAHVKRTHPGLEAADLPARAAATLPVVGAANGEIVSYCGLDCALRAIKGTISEAVWTAWEQATALPGRDYAALPRSLADADW